MESPPILQAKYVEIFVLKNDIRSMFIEMKIKNLTVVLLKKGSFMLPLNYTTNDFSMSTIFSFRPFD
jgi:hypothetical protein